MNIEEYNKKIIINTEGRCDCGKYTLKNNKYKGIVCDECGIEVRISKRIYFDKQEFFKAFNNRRIIKYQKAVTSGTIPQNPE